RPLPCSPASSLRAARAGGAASGAGPVRTAGWGLRGEGACPGLRPSAICHSGRLPRPALGRGRTAAAAAAAAGTGPEGTGGTGGSGEGGGEIGEGEGGGGGQSTLSTTAREMPPLQASMPQGRHLVWKSGAPNRAASRARGLENVAE
ncbi:unnamed protein product, partial [Prorocentrum cordatum]